MRRPHLFAAALCLASLAGCAGLPPSVQSAGSVAREVACTICGATSTDAVDERAAALAEGLRRIAEELARAAEAQGSADVAAIVGELGRQQQAERALFERLIRAASAPAIVPASAPAEAP